MSHGESQEPAAITGFAASSPDVPPPPPQSATPEEKDAYWLRYVYQGDRMPQLTVRAVLMGGVIGMLMSISNLYTVLKVGWLFGVAITACVMSFVIWNFLRVASFGRISQMSILENACMASTASAAGFSTGSTIGTMFGAMVLIESRRLNDPDLSTLSVAPWWIVALFTLCTGALGVFLAIPMKRQMINNEQLPFPSGIAAAQTLRSLYSEGKEAIQKAYSLIIALVGGAVIGILNSSPTTYTDAAGEGATIPKALETVEGTIFGRLPGLVPEQGFSQLDNAGNFVDAVGPNGALDVSKGRELQGFGFEPSGLLIAAGMIVGLRTCLSMVAGSILLFVFVGPWLVAQDFVAMQAGTPDYLQNIKTNRAGTMWRFTDWSLWGGTAVMVTASLTALALQWKTVARSFNIFKKQAPGDETRANSVEVPFTWFIIGMVPITIALICVTVVGFHIQWYWGLVAVFISFFLALVAARATGETDTTPIGAMGKVMQLFFGAVQPGQIIPNLASAGIAANGASAASDLLTDLKTGYALGAHPRRQFIAQFIGVFFGTVAIVPAWYLMVPNARVLNSYPLPSTRQWEAVAELLTKGVDQLQPSALWAIFIGAIVGILLPIIHHLAPRKVKNYLPSAMGLGLAWIMPFANAFSFAIGAIIAWIWFKIERRSSEKFSIAVASGLIAGEGLIKALIAMSATIIGLMYAAAQSAP